MGGTAASRANCMWQFCRDRVTLELCPSPMWLVRGMGPTQALCGWGTLENCLFCLEGIVTAICFFFFFLIVPKTKILATGGASHNRDILQVSAGSRPCTGTSSVPVTSQSQTRDNKNCLCSQGYRDGGLTACPLPGSQLRHLTVHIVSRFCLIHRWSPLPL